MCVSVCLCVCVCVCANQCNLCINGLYPWHFNDIIILFSASVNSLYKLYQ